MSKIGTFLRWPAKVLLPAAAMVLALAGNSNAAGYPDHAIKLIVPWAAGGDTDLIFRPLLPLLQKYLGQPVIISNVGGASGTVGEREAAGAAPDGYTIFGAHDYIHSVYFAGITDIKYSKAFEPVCLIASTPSVITVGAKTPWKSFKELVADAKKRPGEIVVGATLGSTSQYSIALAAQAAGIKFKYVPYQGTAKRMNALLGGHIQVADSNLTQKSKVEAGLLRFLANMSDKRTEGLEDVPTLKELGYNVSYSVNRGLMVPKGTPADVISKINDACAKAVKEPEYAKSLALQGTSARYLGPKGYADYLSETDKQTKSIAKELGLLKRE
ncbi:MAG TPA: tripartite tricarboxylate transporter substrate binding protein [Pseudolabrys sp.]|jgi:tripartite-type tricarboxylate transporter receptor subunit TctC|nr:tripartite tricarboxylate transporter substrate binding protein [Pseudolabrys sp.]